MRTIRSSVVVSIDSSRKVDSCNDVESLGHGPVSCPDSCRSARRTFDDDGRRIEFGNLEPVVRLSTRIGPVSIETR